MNAYKEVLKEHEIDLTKELYFGALGMDDKTFVKSMFDRANKGSEASVVNKVLEAKTKLHRTMIEDELPLCPGVLTFLKGCLTPFLARAGEHGKPRMRLDTCLSVLTSGPLFSVLVMAGDVSACKPAPDCYRRGLEKLNEKRQSERSLPLMASECLAIEDSPPGIESARAVGMRTLGVTNTVSEDALRAVGADVVTKSLADWTTDAVRHVFSCNAGAGTAGVLAC
mgnify:CR=1 FL=1